MTGDVIRVGTWNLEWAKPGTRRHSKALAHLESLDADVIVTTEEYLHEWPAYPHRIDGGPDWGYRRVDGRRKVIGWARTPWSDTRTIDHGATAGRFVAGRTSLDGVSIDVLAVCIPWRDAHVRSGRQDRNVWDEHLEFCETLGHEITDRLADGPVVVAGDFNQRVPRHRQPVRVAEALTRALEPLGVTTKGEQTVGSLIDHVACSSALRAVDVVAWPNTIDEVRISDHSGVAADLHFETSPFR